MTAPHAASDASFHPHVEEAYVLSIKELLAAHAKRSWCVSVRCRPHPGETWQSTRRQEASFELRLGQSEGDLRITYTCGLPQQPAAESDVIHLEATRPPFGGARWWFCCPITEKRAHKLYLFPEHRRFCHRSALATPATYLSQRVAGVNKIYRRLWALRLALPAQGTILVPLRRPPGMHLKTYRRLSQCEEALWHAAMDAWSLEPEISECSEANSQII